MILSAANDQRLSNYLSCSTEQLFYLLLFWTIPYLNLLNISQQVSSKIKAKKYFHLSSIIMKGTFRNVDCIINKFGYNYISQK